MKYDITEAGSVPYLWLEYAQTQPDKDAIVHIRIDEEPFRWTYKELINAALDFGLYLTEKGVKKGEVCAIIIRHNPFFYPIYLAVAFIGAIPAVLAYPNQRLHPDKFRQGLAGMAQRSGLDWIISENDLEDKLRPLVMNGQSTVRGIIRGVDFFTGGRAECESTGEMTELYYGSNIENEPFLLQHSSGTTGLQKPVVLSHLAVLKHIRNYSESLGITESDKIVSWLPLYHDMGLIAAFQMPLALGLTTIQIDPFEWVMAPSILLETVDAEKATLMWLPNFSYNMMADKIREDDIQGISLDSLRLIINCSEPVRFESHQKFLTRFASLGINREKLSTCYAMAEATFAVTQTPSWEEARVVSADRDALKADKIRLVSDDEEAANIRRCVSSGRVISGCSVKIVDEQGIQVGEDRTGEIIISSESLFSGYRNYPEKTAEVLKDGWYHSGDIGFMYDGYLYVIGRKKDIIIVAGNNIYPEDIEDMVSQTAGVIPGRVIAFGEDDPALGSEQVSVIAETSVEDENEMKKLRMDIMRSCTAINVSIRNVYLVPPRWLIKSSSGKPSRSANRARVAEI